MSTERWQAGKQPIIGEFCNTEISVRRRYDYFEFFVVISRKVCGTLIRPLVEDEWASNEIPQDGVRYQNDGVARSQIAKALCINFDHLINKVVKAGGRETFGDEFFESDLWPTRPNSTQRLGVVNYQALRSLSDSVDMDYVFHLDLPKDVSALFDQYSVVIIMQVPSDAAKESVNKILRSLEQRPTRARVVLGTEVTWFADLERGKFTRDQIRSVYTRYTLLRHTARTDVRAYADTDFDNAKIQEFEIGIDCNVIKKRTPITERNHILFVKAPEGRLTKNNEAIEHIKSRIEDDDTFDHLTLTVLEPPYSTHEYWELLQKCRYMIFTSIGETFSYVLNDAKASGVVSLFPARMYENRSGGVVVDSYPDMPGRYTSIDTALDSLRRFETDPGLLLHESKSARKYVVENFSVPKIAKNWLDLIYDHPMNDRKVMFLDLGDSRWTLNEALEQARAYGCDYLVPYLNRGTSVIASWRYSWLDTGSGVSVIRDFLYTSGTTLRRTRGVDGEPHNDDTGLAIKRIPKNEVLRFWRMLIRINKVGHIVTNLKPDNEILRIIETGLHFRKSFKEPYSQVEMTYI